MNFNFSFQKILNWCLYSVVILILLSLTVIGIAGLFKKPDYLPLDKAPAAINKNLKHNAPIEVSGNRQDSLYILSQLEKWQNSQRKGDLSLYLSAYSVVQFKWSEGDYNTWKLLKARNFNHSGKFDLKIRDVKIKSGKRRAISNFVQFTDSEGEFTLKKKNLYWIKEKMDNQEIWKIYKEKEIEL